MAWYYGTFSCGCEGRVNIIGKMDQRDWKVEKAFKKKCEDCYAEYLKEEREKKYLIANNEAKELGLPELSGTEKQIKWAISLRDQYIERFKTLLEPPKDGKFNRSQRSIINDEDYKLITTEKDFEKFLEYILTTKDDAKYYIDMRSEEFSNIIHQDYKNVFKTDSEIITQNEHRNKIKKGTIQPEYSQYHGVVNISFSKDTGRIVADYQKNNNFISIVKSLRYSWNGAWERIISSSLYGTIEDRVAELGNKLLNEGFTICIIDDLVREKAINAEYEKEIDNWILIDNKKENYLKIIWRGRNSDLYNAARKIKGSIYDGVVKVKVSSYLEIRDFAYINDFKITPKAEKLLTEYENEYINIEVVDPVLKKEIIKEDKLAKILDSSREILSDLLDDE